MKPTYKRIKGFAPLQLSCGNYMMDGMLYNGSRHSNGGNKVVTMLKEAIAAIRAGYSKDVPIVVHMDSGFFDGDLFGLLDDWDVGFVCAGKMYAEHRACAALDEADLDPVCGGAFHCCETREKRKGRMTDHRAVYVRNTPNDSQLRLPFAHEHRIVVTNIEAGNDIGRALKAAGCAHLATTEGIVKADHNRGSGELVHRHFKEFRDERLPFKDYESNAGFYLIALFAFNLFQAFKHDVAGHLFEPTAYANTVRRKLFDIAGKIVRHAGKIVLKVTRAARNRLDLRTLWYRANHPPPIRFATT